METHVMTFFMPPSSGLCVKSCLRCSDISASPCTPCCFSKTWRGMHTTPLRSRCGDTTLWWHIFTARDNFVTLRRKILFQGRDFLVCLLSWSGRETSAKQMRISFGEATAAGNPIVEGFRGRLHCRAAFWTDLMWHNLLNGVVTSSFTRCLIV